MASIYDHPGTTLNEKVTPPSLVLTSLEGWRSFFSATHLASNRTFLKDLPQGDGHSVMVIPGFMAGDFTTIFIRYFLKHWGYAAKPWELGLNLGLNKRRETERRMSEQLEKHFLNSGRKVSLVGWSLGGVFARELARKHPEWVRSVISMGSPIGHDPNGAITAGIYQLISGNSFYDPEFMERVEIASQPVPKVPCTAIYSKSDGIVSWKIARELESNIAENIEVKSAHSGLGMNTSVMFAMADRLRQIEHEWEKFDKSQTDRFYFS